MSENIGKQIRRARKKAGLSQEELAEKIHVSKSMIAYLETGRRTPSMVTGRDIARALGMKAEDIFR